MRRSLSLRARLILGVIALAAVGLVAADFATYSALRSFLIDRTDTSLDAAHRRGRRRAVPSRHRSTGVTAITARRRRARRRSTGRGSGGSPPPRPVSTSSCGDSTEPSCALASTPRFPGSAAAPAPRLPAKITLPAGHGRARRLLHRPCEERWRPLSRARVDRAAGEELRRRRRQLAERRRQHPAPPAADRVARHGARPGRHRAARALGRAARAASARGDRVRRRRRSPPAT